MKSSNSMHQLPTKQLMCLNLKERTTNLFGETQEALWDMDGLSLGGALMLNTGESPNAVVESTLSSILEVNVPEKYYLSPRAAQGILNRAKKRGRQLPDILREALEERSGIRPSNVQHGSECSISDGN